MFVPDDVRFCLTVTSAEIVLAELFYSKEYMELSSEK